MTSRWHQRIFCGKFLQSRLRGQFSFENRYWPKSAENENETTIAQNNADSHQMSAGWWNVVGGKSIQQTVSTLHILTSVHRLTCNLPDAAPSGTERNMRGNWVRVRNEGLGDDSWTNGPLVVAWLRAANTGRNPDAVAALPAGADYLASTI